MAYKAVIFDLDGTLLNTLNDIATPINNILAKYDYPIHSLADIRQFIGSGLERLVYCSLPSEVAESPLYSKILEEVRSEYQKYLNNSTILYDGIANLLSKLQSMGISLNILSNKADEFMDEVYNTYFKQWNFDIVLGARKHKPIKPNPTALFEIINDLNLDADECVFVGDSDVDMQTAINAGVFAVGVTWGFRNKEVLIANGANLIIDKPQDLIKLFGG